MYNLYNFWTHLSFRKTFSNSLSLIAGHHGSCSKLLRNPDYWLRIRLVPLQFDSIRFDPITFWGTNEVTRPSLIQMHFGRGRRALNSP